VLCYTVLCYTVLRYATYHDIQIWPSSPFTFYHLSFLTSFYLYLFLSLPLSVTISFLLFLSSDSDDGEAEDDSGTDEDETQEKQEERQKRIPVWAKGALLKEALEKVRHCLSVCLRVWSDVVGKQRYSLRSHTLFPSHIPLHTPLSSTVLHLLSISPVPSSLPFPSLSQQYGMNGHTPMDPDSIFHEVQTCSLEEIFGTKEGKCGA
jgi:Inner centromere protein, ARK binding region